MITVRTANWQTEADALLAIRRTVFIIEQNVPESLEVDGEDERCHHLLACVEGENIGTARMMPDGHIGRVAVLKEHRRKGVGSAILQHFIGQARALALSCVDLNGQTDALPFYEKLGFVPEGEVFMEAGIPHRKLVLRF